MVKSAQNRATLAKHALRLILSELRTVGASEWQVNQWHINKTGTAAGGQALQGQDRLSIR